MELYYSNTTRKITDDSGREHTYEEAMSLYNQGAVSDQNASMSRLINSDGDMDAVDRQYKELE